MRLLILGAGAVVSEYYVPALRMLGWESGALIVDASERSIAALTSVWPGVHARQMDFRKVLNDPTVAEQYNAAIVALPNSMHAEAAELALRRGLHVLCEKPLATTHDACLRLARAADDADRILSVGMVRRRLASFELLRMALREGLIGDLVGIDVEDGEPYAWLSDSGSYFKRENGGALMDMGVHYLDFIEEIVGELSPCTYADDARGGVEADLTYTLRARETLPVRLALSRTRRLRNTLVCRGQRGELRVAKDRFDRCTWYSFESGEETTLLRDEKGAAGLEAAFACQLAEFAESIEQHTQPAVSANRAASTIGLIDWAYTHRDEERPAPAAARHPLTEGEGLDLPPGRVVVTGATGFIGSHLVERLFETGTTNVVAPVRNYRTCADIARFPVHMPRVDLLDPTAVRQAVDGARFVFHLAYGRDGPDAERVTVEGTRTVVEAAIAAGCEAVVVLSTIYVFGQPAAHVDETWPYHPVGGAYGASKAAIERWCLQRARSSLTTRIVVLCPSCVYGPRGSTYSEMPARMTRDRSFCLIEGGAGAANYAYVGNVVDAMLAAARTKAGHGERFIISDGATSWRTFFECLLGKRALQLPSYTRDQLTQRHRTRPRPRLQDVARVIVGNQEVRSTLRETRLGSLGLTAVERISPAVMHRLRAKPSRTEQQPATQPAPEPLPPDWLGDLFGPSQTVFVADKARRMLGWEPAVSLADGMQRTREWLEHQGVYAGCR